MLRSNSQSISRHQRGTDASTKGKVRHFCRSMNTSFLLFNNLLFFSFKMYLTSTIEQGGLELKRIQFFGPSEKRWIIISCIFSILGVWVVLTVLRQKLLPTRQPIHPSRTPPTQLAAAQEASRDAALSAAVVLKYNLIY